jgi:hypothetical protein
MVNMLVKMGQFSLVNCGKKKRPQTMVLLFVKKLPALENHRKKLSQGVLASHKSFVVLKKSIKSALKLSTIQHILLTLLALLLLIIIHDKVKKSSKRAKMYVKSIQRSRDLICRPIKWIVSNVVFIAYI